MVCFYQFLVKIKKILLNKAQHYNDILIFSTQKQDGLTVREPWLTLRCIGLLLEEPQSLTWGEKEKERKK